MQRQPKADVSVIIPSYQSGHLLPPCLEAVKANPRVLEIIVVDDASTDNTAAVVDRYGMRAIKNGSNKGPVVARNLGAREATGTYLLFLDSDIALQPDYVSKLANFLDSHPNAGGCSGKVLSQNGERIWFNFGYRFSVRGVIGNVLFIKTFKFWNGTFLDPIVRRLSTPFTLNFAPDKEREVSWCIESAFMTPARIFQKVQGFDEGFFMFHEGPDYSLRAKALGYPTYYLPEAVAWHLDLLSRPTTRHTTRAQSDKRYLEKHGLPLW